MSTLGVVLLLLVGVVMISTGLPAFAALIAGALTGAVIGALFGDLPLSLYASLPVRILGLLEHDLLQALPLFVFMGVLLDRMAIAPNLFAVLSSALGRFRHGPAAAGMLLGGLIAPMNGSVGASVLAVTGCVAPRLEDAGAPPALRLAIVAVAVAGTLGIVVPPSLVLILLGDAMMSAHTIAVNTAGRSDQIINTQEVFRGALVPASLVLGASTLVAAVSPWRIISTPPPARSTPPSLGGYFLAIATICGLVSLLAGVALGRLYAVEAAATGAVILIATGFLTRRLSLRNLHDLLGDVMLATGALFAPLVAATTFTMVLRTLGTDRLVASWVASLPGSPTLAMAVVLAVIAIAALVLDAFEIIFVVVPIVMPPLLVRVPDAVWVSALTLLTLQASFLLPPAGYALLMARGALAVAPEMRKLLAALLPFLIVQATVLLLVLAEPRIVHMLSSTTPARSPAPSRPDHPTPEIVPPAGISQPTLTTAPPAFD